MDNKKKTDSIMRYVVYLLCGVLLAGYSLLKWNAMSEMKYLYPDSNSFPENRASSFACRTFSSSSIGRTE